MRVFALELDNELKGIEARKIYIESLIARLPRPELIVLPELALPSYMASQEIWRYADVGGEDATRWAVELAQRYGTFIGAGFLAKDGRDFYNRYLIAGPEGVCGVVNKSEGESAVFKRGDFPCVIETPFGKVGVAICYDSRRKRFYEKAKDEELSLILFPHGAPADPKKPERERADNDRRCLAYAEAFGVPVVYVNCVGPLEYMPGKMGAMMAKHGFRMNGMSKIYAPSVPGDSGASGVADGSGPRGAVPIDSGVHEAIGAEVAIVPRRRSGEIRFYGEDILPGNRLFKRFVLESDTKAGIAAYERGIREVESM